MTVDAMLTELEHQGAKGGFPVTHGTYGSKDNSNDFSTVQKPHLVNLSSSSNLKGQFQGQWDGLVVSPILDGIPPSLKGRSSSAVEPGVTSSKHSSRAITPLMPTGYGVKRSDSTLKEKLALTSHFFSTRKLQQPERMLGLTQQDLLKIFSHKVSALSVDPPKSEQSSLRPAHSGDAVTDPPSSTFTELHEPTALDPSSEGISPALSLGNCDSSEGTSSTFFLNNHKAAKRYLIVSKVKRGKYGGIVVALRVATNELVIIKQVNIFSLPANQRYSFPCTGGSKCKCQNCSRHPLQPLTVGPSRGAEYRAAAAAIGATSAHSGVYHAAHNGAVAPFDINTNLTILQLNQQHSPAQFLFSENGPFKEASPLPPTAVNDNLEQSPATVIQPETAENLVPSFEGTVPLELVSLQTENDADELPSFVEYWVHRSSGTFFFVTYTHGPRQRKWRNPKTWFRGRFFNVNWEAYLS